jgi:hypothetical protein
MRDIYLEENPSCVRCGRRARQVHHIAGGTAGRAASLLNSDTWLGVCSSECHEAVDRMTIEAQIRLKQKKVRETIKRLLT